PHRLQLRFFFLNDTPPTDIYTLSLHDALPICTRLVRWVSPIERVGAGMLMIAPFSVALTRAPMVGFFTLLGGFLTLASGVVVHALTLPTELDASFVRALPLLKRRRLLRDEDLPRARKLLAAAALTYVAVALQSLLNIARWWAILRRR